MKPLGKMIFRSFLFALFIFLVGCGRGGSSGSGGDSPGDNNQPNIRSGTSSLMEGVAVLDSFTESQITASTDTSMTFDGAPSTIVNLKPGDIFIVQNTARKAESVTTVDGQTVVRTVEPEFSEVIKDLNVKVSIMLSEEDIDTSSLPAKARLAVTRSKPSDKVTTEKKANTFTLTIEDEVIYDADDDPNTKFDQVLANGSVVLDRPQVDIDFEFGLFSDKYASINFKTGEKVDITLSSQNLSFNKSKTVSLLRFIVPIPVTGGAVNVTVSLNLVFGANGSAKIVAGLFQELSFDAGMKATLKPATFTSTNNTSYTFDIKQPQFEGEVNAFAAVNPDVDARLLQYSLAGINNSLGVKATSKVNATLVNACLRILANADLSSTAFVMLPKASLNINFSWDNFALDADIGMEKHSRELFKFTNSIYDSGDFCLIENSPPVANAGLDLTANTNAAVFLNGTGSFDSDGTISSYAWTQTGGTSVVLRNANTATPSFTAPSAADTLTFRLTVTDNKGTAASDDMNVTILAGDTNIRPKANAGFDQTVITNAAVFLNGTGSFDSDGTISSYAWTQTGGTSVVLGNANTATPSFTAPSAADTLTFRLTVIDNKGANASDYVQVSVIAAVVTLPALDVSIGGTGSGTVSGTGISCPGDCSQTYPSGTHVTLTASPVSGSVFDGWNGCTGSTANSDGSSATCDIIMTADKSVAVTFNTEVPVTVLLQGMVFNSQSGQGNLGPEGHVTIAELNLSVFVIVREDFSVYSIQGVPVGRSYTLNFTDLTGSTVNLTCEIAIPDSATLEVTRSIGGNCTVGTATNPGELVLNLTLSNTPQLTPAVRFSVIDLGDLPGGNDSSIAHAINDRGEVVGSSSGVADSNYSGFGFGQANKPFLWTSTSGIQEIGPPPLIPAGAGGGEANGINDAGEVVGYIDYGFAGRFRPFIWTATDGMQLLQHEPGNTGGFIESGGAEAINSHGEVVGTAGGSAFRWTAAGGRIDLGIGGQNSSANTINNLGYVGGSAGISDCNFHPLIWDPDGQLQGVNLPTSYASPDIMLCGGRVVDINDNGVVIGFVGIETIPRTISSAHSFISSPTSSAQDLGEVRVAGINNDGHVIGSRNNRAFLWTPENGIVDLNGLLDGSGTGWELTWASAINNLGQIVGSGIHNGVSRASLLTPLASPSP